MRNMLRVSVAAMLAASNAAAALADTFRIELDYMVAAGHSHMPSQDVIDACVQTFACAGHTLIIDVDDAIPHYNVMPSNPNNCNSFFGYTGEAASFGSLRDTYFDRIDDPDWNYCIFGHNYEDNNCNTTGSSGLGQLPGRYFVVTLGSFSGQTGTEFDQAATLIHEFGHNLGLSHCGQGDCNTPGNYNPLLTSVMSYRYQLAGVRNNVLCNALAPEQAKFRDIDYSWGRNCSLNEASLNENNGTFMTPVDWNCNGSFQANVAQDIGGGNSGWCGSNGSLSTLVDLNEWAVVDTFTDLRDRGELPEPVEVSCITADEWAVVQIELDQRGSCGQPALATESCLDGQNVFLLTGGGVTGDGRCSNPYRSVQVAETNGPTGSTFFLRPGTYDESGQTVINKRSVWMSPLGVSVVR